MLAKLTVKKSSRESIFSRDFISLALHYSTFRIGISEKITSRSD
jgi:hypothetical protein